LDEFTGDSDGGRFGSDDGDGARTVEDCLSADAPASLPPKRWSSRCVCSWGVGRALTCLDDDRWARSRAAARDPPPAMPPIPRAIRGLLGVTRVYP